MRFAEIVQISPSISERSPPNTSPVLDALRIVNSSARAATPSILRKSAKNSGKAR